MNKQRGFHAYTECSSKGKCNRETGECECYPGYEGMGCRRTTCPNDCSGHGRCIYNEQHNAEYDATKTGLTFKDFDLNSQFWDADKTRQCDCDRGFGGYDCSERLCPRGDDPLTQHTDCTTFQEDVQVLDFVSEQRACEGYFSLTFKTSNGGTFTTKPIYLDLDECSNSLCGSGGDVCVSDITQTCTSVSTCGELLQATCEHADTIGCEWDSSAVVCKADDDGCSTGWTATDADSNTVCAAKNYCVYTYTNPSAATTAAAIEEALEALPNFAIPDVTVSYADKEDGKFYVTFNHKSNSGKQNLLQCSNAQSASSTASEPFHANVAAQPRFEPLVAEYRENFPYKKKLNAWAACKVTHQTSHWVNSDGADEYEEHDVCSNRGSCDTETGLCVCGDGYSGEACEEQTIFY